MKYLFMIALALTFSIFWGNAIANEQNKLSLPTVFGDNMVLQRDHAVPIWGRATPNEIISIEFADQKIFATTDASGKWQTALKAMPANIKPEDLKIHGSNTIAIKNVVVGDVWICSGQSNMEFEMKDVLNAKKEKITAEFPLIRHVKVGHQLSREPLMHFKGRWIECSPQTVSNFTAVGYFFGRRLHQELDVPIGLINISWAATRIEPWTPLAGFMSIKEQKFAADIIKHIEFFDLKTVIGKASYAKEIAAVEAWVVKTKSNIAVGKFPPVFPVLASIKPKRQYPTHLYSGMVAPVVMALPRFVMPNSRHLILRTQGWQ